MLANFHISEKIVINFLSLIAFLSFVIDLFVKKLDNLF